MDWKKEAMDKLRQYEARKHALESIPTEIEQMKMIRRGIRSAASDGSPVRGGGNGRENMLLSSMVKEEELKGNLVLARSWVRQVDNALRLMSEEERLILDRFYIHPEKNAADRLCGDLHVERSQVYVKKDCALRHFTIALYGFCDT